MQLQSTVEQFQMKTYKTNVETLTNIKTRIKLIDQKVSQFIKSYYCFFDFNKLKRQRQKRNEMK